MQNTPLKYFRPDYWFYLFLLVHLLCWTLAPALVRYNLPLDALEGTVWGHQLEWGYDKNPFMNGWLTALAVYLGGSSGWMIYLFSQLSVAACLWVIWQLGKKMLSPLYALVAVMILEGVQYFNFHAIDFNDNTLELGLWALTSYFFYQALRSKHQTLHWLLTGLFAGFAMMAKYYTAALLAAMFLFLIIRPENRKQFIQLPLYLGLGVFLSIILPHIIWLFFHEFITVTYVFDRTNSTPSWTNHFFFPAQFAWQQAQVFLPALLLYGLLFIGKKPFFAKPKLTLASFDKAFLFYVGLGPFLLTLLLSFLSGIKLRAGWGMPLLSFWSIILIALIQVAMTKAKLYRFLATVYILLAVLVGAYAISLIDSPDTSSANFPGQKIAQTINETWRAKYHTPLAYVAGSRWVGGNISFYSKDRPAVFVEWNAARAPWININDLEQKGAVFVWDVSDKESLPKEIQTQFPRLSAPTVLEFSWRRNHYQLPPVKIGVAYLPPKSKRN